MDKRVLIARWLGSYTQAIPIYDEPSVSSVRQRVREVGEQLSLSRTLTESLALIASELAHNHLRHAKQGYLAVRGLDEFGTKGIEVIAADLGPGIHKPDSAIRGNAASAGSLGAGLGAVCRVADEVEFDNRIEEGFCVVARKFEKPPLAARSTVAIMGKPYPGEGISGDDAVFIHTKSGFIATVADGLGHGPEAREASNRAIESVIRNRDLDMAQLVIAVNDDLAGTRGCAMSIVSFLNEGGRMEAASGGDVHSHLYTLREAHLFTATPLILGSGGAPKKIRIETTTAEAGSVLVMFTDGLKSRTNLKAQMNMLRQPPIIIAQHLLENFGRPDDDALVLVARLPRS